MVNHFAKRVREQQSRSSEVERVFAAATEPAESFDCRRRFAALWTKRLLQRHETRPAIRACPSPTALPYWSVTYDARDWEQEIENVIEQSAFGETQKAKRVYNNSKQNSPPRGFAQKLHDVGLSAVAAVIDVFDRRQYSKLRDRRWS